MQEILLQLTELLEDNKQFSFEVLNPDVSSSSYAGSTLEIQGESYIYRGYKAWIDLAQILFCKMLTPKLINEHTVVLTFQKLNREDSFHTGDVEDVKEKYGSQSHFSAIHKSEEPAFIHAYTKALEAVKVGSRKHILNLGVNSGDEFKTIQNMLENPTFNAIKFTGIDYSTSAIAQAKENFPSSNMNFYAHDINDMDSLSLEKSDLIISIGTLQSSSLNFKPFFSSLVQNYLTKDGAIILGFPNCRWIDGEMVYGAKAPNYSYSEMSIVVKDIYYCKKYLQQHKYRVTITGKDYLFLTATSIR